MNPEPNPPTSRDSLIRSAVPSGVVVILAHKPDMKSNVLTLQNYYRDGRLFIPIFRSKESFQQSTRGEVDKPILWMDRRLFVSMLRGAETIILDLGLPDEIVTGAEELKRIFPEPFDVSRPREME
jgi:SseB protein N-terminal domain